MTTVTRRVLHHGGSDLEKRLERIRNKANRLIVGIETGNTIGRLGAVIVEVSGKGDDTLLALHAFRSLEMPSELLATLKALEADNDFDSEEAAGINFLILHQISSLYRELFEGVDIDFKDVDVIGLKCIEMGGRTFPEDPSVLSEMTGSIVASRFMIGLENGEGIPVRVNEPILQGMVGEMVEKFELDAEAREAVAVALLANESIYHERSSFGTGVKCKGKRGSKSEKAGLFGEFYFPA